MRVLSFLLIVALAAGCGWAYIFGPYYLDAWKMQDVVGSAALSWSAFTEEKGRAQLREELQRREIPGYFTEDKCTFYEEPDGMKVVDCEWYVDVYPPLVAPRRLKFSVAKAASASGVLEDR